MPRGNRYIVPGNIYHLTHRCHDREFLLKFTCDRDGYRRRLREAILAVDLSLLTYNITSNHVHLIAYADNSEQVAVFMQQAAGEFARDYNRRKERSGLPFQGEGFRKVSISSRERQGGTKWDVTRFQNGHLEMHVATRERLAARNARV